MPDQSDLAAGRPIRAEVDGNSLELIESGSQRMHAILALIDQARSTIELLMYMYNADEAGEKVREALAAAARRGVEVRLLVDGFGSAASTDFFNSIGEEGGDYCVFNPDYGRRYLLRNHQKLVIADRRIVLVGGANIDQTYLSDTAPGRWRDIWLRVEGSQAAVASDYFDALYRWSKTKNAKMGALRRIVARHCQQSGTLQWKFSGPLTGRNSWWRSIGSDIAGGTRLDMIFAYFAPPAAMLRRIGRLAARGRARVVTAAKSDNEATIAAARHSYSRLLRRKVQMYEYQPAKLHTKLAVVDDVVHIGSSNFDFRSFFINLEVMLRIEDAAFADAMRGYLERELQDCEPITPTLHKRRANLWRRFKWALSHFLVNVADYTVTRRLNFRLED